MGCKATWRNSSLGNVCEHFKFWASAKSSSLEQAIVQKHWTFSVQLRKYIFFRDSSTYNVLAYHTKELRIIFYHFSQVFVFLILFVYCLITSPFLLVAMAMSGGGCYYASLKQVKFSNVLFLQIVFQNMAFLSANLSFFV